jgi:hypothetical protein
MWAVRAAVSVRYRTVGRCALVVPRRRCTQDGFVFDSEQTLVVTVDIVASQCPAMAVARIDGRQGWHLTTKEQVMSLGTILLIVVILMLIGVLPVWPHARSWGYAPSGLAGAALVILIVLFLMGRL